MGRGLTSGYFIAVRALNAGGIMALINLTRLTEDSLSSFGTTTALYPDGKVKTLDEVGDFAKVLTGLKGRRVYSVKNNVLAFVFEGYFMVTPWTRQKVECLKTEGGFDEEEFFVPFADGSIPELREKFWGKLLEDASYYNSKPQAAEPLT